jgi:hypothetical protein
LLELNPVFFYLPFETGFYEKTEYHTPLFSYFLRGPPIQLTRMS